MEESATDMKPIFDTKSTRIALVMLLILFFPISVVHEIGHIIICVNSGSSYESHFNVLELGIMCTPLPKTVLLYWAFGGILGMLVSLCPILALNWMRNHKGVMIGLFSLASMQGVNAFIETFAHTWYIQGGTLPSIMFTLVGLAFLFVFLNFFARVRR